MTQVMASKKMMMIIIIIEIEIVIQLLYRFVAMPSNPATNCSEKERAKQKEEIKERR